MRYFYNKYNEQEFDPIDTPFLEIKMTSKKMKFSSEGLREDVQNIINDITQEKKG